MKEEDSNPLEPVGDEPIEARIVAWVLGDASAFEAAELERLCAANPELEVFRRRMLALHGLLGEAGDTAPDDHWKLSPDRRTKIESLFHAPSAPATATLLKPEKRSGQPWIRQALMATAACLVLAAGFRYVFAPAKDGHATLAVNESVGVMSSRKPSETSWAGRELPMAEGYASSQPVLPEIADADGELLGRTELIPNRPMGEELKIGDRVWKSVDGNDLADNSERGSAPRSRAKTTPAKPAAPPVGTPPPRFAAHGLGSNMSFGAVAPPAPAITAAPATPEAKTDLASSSAVRSNTDFISPVDGQAIAGVPAADETNIRNIITGGLRSGDGAISRNNIDSVLNNPDRVAQAKGEKLSEEIAKNQSAVGLAFDTPAPPSSGPALAAKEKNAWKESDQLGQAGESTALDAERTKPSDSGSFALTGKKAQDADYRLALGDRKQPSERDKDFSNLDEMGRFTTSKQEPDTPSEKPQATLSGEYRYQSAPSDPMTPPPAKEEGELLTKRSEPGLPPDAVPSDSFQNGGAEGKPGYGGLIQREMIPRQTVKPGSAGLADQDSRTPNLGAPLNANSTSVEGFKKAIQEQEQRLAVADDRLAKFKMLSNERQNGALERSIDSTDYLNARSSLETEQDKLKAMKTRLIAEKMAARLDSSAKDASEARLASQSEVVREQEDKVEEKRKLLTNIVRTKGIILTGQESLYGTALNEDDRGAVSARETANKLEQEKIQIESQIQTLLKHDSDQLLTYAAGLNLPENIIKTLYPQYLEQQRLVGKLKAEGLADNHPAVRAQTQALAKMKTQLDEGVAALKDTLRAQLSLAEDRLTALGVPGQLEQNKVREEARLADLKKQLAAAEAATPAPSRPAPVPTDETVAAAEPFSTFSLHVSDASFKLAKAALDRGERLSADQIRTEEFYNAVDYGDPAPASGEPVACTIEQAAHPMLPQRNIVRVAMRVGSAGRGQGQPLNLTLLLDNSGSMEREDRHEGLKAAIAQLASLLQPGDTVTLAGFSRTPHLLADRLSGAEAGKLVDLVDKLPSEGGTNLEEALKLAGELAIQRKNPAAQNRIVLLTDGAANLGNAQPEDLAQKVAALRQQGIAFDAAGIGAGGLNDRMLEALTRHGNGRYYIVNDPKDADANFAKQLAGAFRPAAENVKVQVHFNPDRVSRYKLIGFEKHRLNTEDFHNDAVDAAELAADEAGVALYQIETRPDGSGEIGEVSVRFRDTAAGKMIENTWTISHDEKAPAFDQARPSIQLATLAMLAAEKLRGGPLAEATDFTTLSPVISRVKNYYSTSSRVGELTGMTGKLR